MVGFFIAALVAGAAPTASPRTLAGMTLGAALVNVASEHAGAQRRATATGSEWSWRRPEGGKVTVLVDRTGRITSIDFAADKGERDSIDLPCVVSFPIQDSHVNLGMAMAGTECSAISDWKYRLQDGSVLDVSFEEPGDGQLEQATWYRPLPVGPNACGQALYGLYGASTDEANAGSASCPAGCGTVFEVNPSTGKERVIYSFHRGASWMLAEAKNG